MAARGVILSYETVRRWTLKFGQQYANELNRRRPQSGGKCVMSLINWSSRNERILYFCLSFTRRVPALSRVGLAKEALRKLQSNR